MTQWVLNTPKKDLEVKFTNLNEDFSMSLRVLLVLIPTDAVLTRNFKRPGQRRSTQPGLPNFSAANALETSVTDSPNDD